MKALFKTIFMALYFIVLPIIFINIIINEPPLFVVIVLGYVASFITFNNYYKVEFKFDSDSNTFFILPTLGTSHNITGLMWLWFAITIEYKLKPKKI